MNARLQTAQSEAFVLNAEHAIGQIAVQLPGATAIFRRLKLDFCCGGQISLAQAASDKGLDVQVVMKELAALQRSDSPVGQTDPTILIDHILARYHEVHREQLPELIRMARRVEAVHRDHPQVPAGLAQLLEHAEKDLLVHLFKEENTLFPMLNAGGDPVARQHIDAMRAEHIKLGSMLEQLLALSNNATPPEGACNTWRALYGGIAQMHDDLSNNIHLENNILFTQFEAPIAARVKSPCCGACG
jgi:regulator of cell morphogenesis and NO signaling